MADPPIDPPPTDDELELPHFCAGSPEMTAQEYWQLNDDIDAGLYGMDHPTHPRAVPLTPEHKRALAARREAFLRMMRRLDPQAPS